MNKPVTTWIWRSNCKWKSQKWRIRSFKTDGNLSLPVFPSLLPAMQWNTFYTFQQKKIKPGKVCPNRLQKHLKLSVSVHLSCYFSSCKKEWQKKLWKLATSVEIKEWRHKNAYWRQSSKPDFSYKCFIYCLHYCHHYPSSQAKKSSTTHM